MFNLYTPPCFAALGAMNSEMKSQKWLWGAIGLQLSTGFIVGYLVYQFGTLFTEGHLGAGFFAILLANRGHKVTGIDMSPKMIHEAKKNMLEFGCRIDFKKMNAQELNFDDESFDVVISRNLTWTLPNVMQAYREWHRVLKDGGILLNFDSDYGDKNFLNDQTCAKAEVDNEMLVECNSIKNELKISTHTRPQWDIDFLTSIGFKVKFDNDIAPLVHKDNNMEYDFVPLFAIYATKFIREVPLTNFKSVS